jgi:hypothetical protein
MEYHSDPAADPAPTVFGNFQREGNLKPQGKNITEDDSMPGSDNNNSNTTTVPGDVGGPQDPGRVAERKMLSHDADTSAGENAGGARQYGIERSTGEFDVLSSEASTHPGDSVGPESESERWSKCGGELMSSRCRVGSLGKIEGEQLAKSGPVGLMGLEKKEKKKPAYRV